MKNTFIKVLAAAAAAAMMTAFLPAIPARAQAQETKLIALTFDDGPNTTTTNDVLDILEEYGAKA
ncbi:MAG: polysaccharide deacetylase family protein [Ruminococcus sp.]|nr:polysaccharide deacetylase family protein [Ruminococcus sp.]